MNNNKKKKNWWLELNIGLIKEYIYWTKFTWRANTTLWNATYVIPISTLQVLSLEQIYFQRIEFQLKRNKKNRIKKNNWTEPSWKVQHAIKNLSYISLICLQQKLECTENLKYCAKESVVAYSATGLVSLQECITFWK